MTDGYLNFDEYIRQGEPEKRLKTDAWRVAIGLQAVDGLKVSDYLLELARRNIEGELTIDEVISIAERTRCKEEGTNERIHDLYQN